MGWESLISVAAAAHDAGAFKGWKQWLWRKRKILVLGASGAGKTQFVHSLIDPLSPALDAFLQRTVAPQPRDVVLDDHRFRLVDTPGQRLDEAKRKVPIADAIGKGVEGIINIVCFGYHEAAEAGSVHAVPTAGGQIARADYLAARRQVELSLLSEWVPWLDPKMARWVLTVVTKADLWWPDDQSRIKRYYEEGEYGGAFAGLPVGHSVLPYCSVISPFYGGKTSGRFGDRHRALLQAHLKETLIRLTGAVR